jgi:uncharacterized protein (DUF4415 family)
MTESKRPLGGNLAKLDATTDEEIARRIAEDPDTTPELTVAWFEDAEVWEGNRYIGPAQREAVISGTKERVTLWLDRDVLARVRADGPGWQTRLNDTLKAMVRAIT